MFLGLKTTQREGSMRTVYRVAVFAAVLSLGGLLRADDTVILTDGTVLHGQVMEESSDQVVLSDNGVQRTLQRGLVAKVEFDTGPSASSPAPDDSSAGNTVPSAPAASAPDSSAGPVPGGDGDTVPSAPSGEVAEPADGGNTVPALPTQDQQDYLDGISAYYQAPPDQVWGFVQQGIPYQELPVVFYVASRAQCDPALVVNLRLQGMSWGDICMHFGLGPGIFYWRSLWGMDLGGPYEGIYLGFRRYPHRLWRWNVLALSDAEIIDCVNMRFSTAYWGCTPFEVAQWRGFGHPYFWGGFYVHGHFFGRGRVWSGGGHSAYRYYGHGHYYGGHGGYGGGGFHGGFSVHGGGGGGGWNHGGGGWSHGGGGGGGGGWNHGGGGGGGGQWNHN
jgi:hypothetical protein